MALFPCASADVTGTIFAWRWQTAVLSSHKGKGDKLSISASSSVPDDCGPVDGLAIQYSLVLPRQYIDIAIHRLG